MIVRVPHDTPYQSVGLPQQNRCISGNGILNETRFTTDGSLAFVRLPICLAFSCSAGGLVDMRQLPNRTERRTNASALRAFRPSLLPCPAGRATPGGECDPSNCRTNRMNCAARRINE